MTTSGTTGGVLRGQNGTTAAAHSAKGDLRLSADVADRGSVPDVGGLSRDAG